MARVGILFGLLLCGLTVAGLVATAEKVPSQFVPMMLGIPVLFCGVVALNPHRRQQSMFVIGCIASAGTLGGTGRLLMWLVHWMREGEYVRNAFNVTTALTLVSATLLTICVVWFFQDRRRRAEGAESEAAQQHARESQVQLPLSMQNDSNTDKVRLRETA